MSTSWTAPSQEANSIRPEAFQNYFAGKASLLTAATLLLGFNVANLFSKTKHLVKDVEEADTMLMLVGRVGSLASCTISTGLLMVSSFGLCFQCYFGTDIMVMDSLKNKGWTQEFVSAFRWTSEVNKWCLLSGLLLFGLSLAFEALGFIDFSDGVFPDPWNNTFSRDLLKSVLMTVCCVCFSSAAIASGAILKTWVSMYSFMRNIHDEAPQNATLTNPGAMFSTVTSPARPQDIQVDGTRPTQAESVPLLSQPVHPSGSPPPAQVDPLADNRQGAPLVDPLEESRPRPLSDATRDYPKQWVRLARGTWIVIKDVDGKGAHLALVVDSGDVHGHIIATWLEASEARSGIQVPPRKVTQLIKYEQIRQIVFSGLKVLCGGTRPGRITSFDFMTVECNIGFDHELPEKMFDWPCIFEEEHTTKKEMIKLGDITDIDTIGMVSTPFLAFTSSEPQDLKGQYHTVESPAKRWQQLIDFANGIYVQPVVVPPVSLPGPQTIAKQKADYIVVLDNQLKKATEQASSKQEVLQMQRSCEQRKAALEEHAMQIMDEFRNAERKALEDMLQRHYQLQKGHGDVQRRSAMDMQVQIGVNGLN